MASSVGSEFEGNGAEVVDIPTVGEWAHRILLDLQQFLAVDDHSGSLNATVVNMAVDFVCSCFALMDKFPLQSRMAFARTLPFSELEQQLMRQLRVEAEDHCVADKVADRVIEWATRSPIVVDELNVHVADFMRELWPNLDRWAEREAVTRAIQQQYQYESSAADMATYRRQSLNDYS